MCLWSFRTMSQLLFFSTPSFLFYFLWLNKFACLTGPNWNVNVCMWAHHLMEEHSQCDTFCILDFSLIIKLCFFLFSLLISLLFSLTPHHNLLHLLLRSFLCKLLPPLYICVSSFLVAHLFLFACHLLPGFFFSQTAKCEDGAKKAE